MPGLYIITALTLVSSASVWSLYLYAFSGKQARFLWLILLGLPLSFLVNLVKRPLPGLIAEAAGIEPVFRLSSPWWFLLFVAFLAPLTEELVKVSPLMLPWLRKTVWGREAGLWAGLALGIGFGLSELLYLGFSLMKAPEYQALPWYYFFGFFGERLVVVGAHGMMTGLAVYGLSQGPARGLLGYLSAVGLHFLVNLGSLLAALRLISPSMAQVPLLAVLLLLIYLFERLRRSMILNERAQKKSEVIFER